MFRSIHIQGFRGLKDFSMKNLGRVNLLVGTNNSGKSSILEGLELLSSRGSVRTIWNATYRRGERFYVEDDTRRYSEGDISHLFFGHGFDIGSSIKISAESDSDSQEVVVEVVPLDEKQASLFSEQASAQLSEDLGMRVSWHNGKPHSVVEIPLSPRGGLNSRNVSRRPSDAVESPPVQFISTSALSINEVLTLFDEVVLSPEEELLVEALQTIEPSIVRIASIGSDRSRYPGSLRQGGIVVKLQDFPDRIPIGSMGDGIWRMLGIALSLVNAENGLVLIDEIDTGLHYSVLSKMWRLVQATADRLNVQVFATTHSRDCYESLATISREGVSDDSCVTIQRIESDSPVATVFTEQEIVAASERGIEVR